MTLQSGGSAEDWLRDEFLPAVPADSVVVIASRRPPDAAWLSDPGWREMLRVILLRNLSATHIRTLLAVEGIDVDLQSKGSMSTCSTR